MNQLDEEQQAPVQLAARLDRDRYEEAVTQYVQSGSFEFTPHTKAAVEARLLPTPASALPRLLQPQHQQEQAEEERESREEQAWASPPSPPMA